MQELHGTAEIPEDYADPSEPDFVEAGRWLARQKELYAGQKLLRRRVRLLKEALGGWGGCIRVCAMICFLYHLTPSPQGQLGALWMGRPCPWFPLVLPSWRQLPRCLLFLPPHHLLGPPA